VRREARAYPRERLETVASGEHADEGGARSGLPEPAIRWGWAL